MDELENLSPIASVATMYQDPEFDTDDPCKGVQDAAQNKGDSEKNDR